MAASTPAPPLRAARIAVFAVFSLNGLASALWFVHIPAVTARTGVSHTTLGMLILLMSASAIVSMQAAGKLTDRYGSRAVTTASAILTTLAILGPAFATNPLTLGLALATYGLGFGALDVAMNAQAVEVEIGYSRPIMSAFHALFSGGSLAGALAGAAAQRAGLDMRVTMLVAATIGLATIAANAPRLLPPAPATSQADKATNSSAAQAGKPASNGAMAANTNDRPHPRLQEPSAERRSLPHESASSTNLSPNDAAARADLSSAHANTAAPQAGTPAPDDAIAAEIDDRSAVPAPDLSPSDAAARAELSFAHANTAGARTGEQIPTGREAQKVLALATIAFALLMAEGVVGDWSALQMREGVGADAATAALAFGAFSVTMTLGRLLADRVSGRFGPVAVVRWGTLLAAAGFTLVVVSPWIPLTLAGWALCGIGLSGGVPQVFTAAGNLGSTTAATDMSRVFGVGYIGLLAGPVIIGWLTKLVPLTAAMLVPLFAMVLCAWFAHIVAPTERRAHAESPLSN